MVSYALPIFRAGHIPILGEWLALPLVALAGSRIMGDEAFKEIIPSDRGSITGKVRHASYEGLFRDSMSMACLRGIPTSWQSR